MLGSEVQLSSSTWRRRVTINNFTFLQRSPMATLLLHLLLVVSSTLVVASWGEARMSDGSSMSKEVSMGVASIRRELATNATIMNATQSLAEDADVLLLFKAAITSDPLNVTRYWKPIGKRQVINPCRPWVGITCTKRRVTAINLHNRSLGGTLPTVLGRLSQLKTLNLSTNSFFGAVPSELSAASSLETLDLGSNNLTGSLPSSLGDLRNLTSLVVAGNAFRGAILPTWVSNLTSLRTLNFSGNGFSGIIPAMAQGLEVLDLRGNNLNGTLPGDFGRLGNLTVLDVGNNMLLGGLPTVLGNCTSLVTLDVSGNPLLGGGIPSALGNLIRLQSLHLAGSNLTGMIPQELTALTALTEVDFSDNSLSGAIPFQNLKNLTLLHLRNNLLEGDFLSRVPTFPTLASLDLRRNRLNGSIPDGVGQLASIQRIDLSANRLSGSVPNAISTCLSLTELNVSYNALNGSLPTLANLHNLKLYDGSFNSFSGGVLSTFVNFSTLQSLNVSSNRLSGEVPFFRPHDNVTERSFLNNSALCGSVLGVGCGSGHKLATSTIVYIVTGSAAGLIAFLVVVFFLFTYCKRWNRKGSKHSSQVSAELQLKVTPDELLAATNQFDEGGYLGGGKLSAVYKGVLPDETVVAVKRLAIHIPEGKEEEAGKALEAELEVLGHMRHKSLVKVLGYCASAETKALVLEYMPNGSLDSFLHPPLNKEVNRAFDWTVRFKIAVEVAEGLKYLHVESRHPVVHGDVKPSNILFDANMEARVADFGVARVLTEQGFGPTSSPSTSATNAYGYTSPDVAASGVASMKGDVYGFGIIMLEMITGRSPYTVEREGQTLPEWVRATVSNSKALQNVLDPHLMSDLASHQQKMAMLLGVALLCTRKEPQERPSMDDVYKMLVHIRSKSSQQASRRKGLLLTSGRRNSSAVRRSRSTASEVQPVYQQQQPPLPHTPSLSDWTPPIHV